MIYQSSIFLLRSLCIIASVAALILPARAQKIADITPDKPKLVLLLIIDNLNNQQLDVIRKQCGTKGYNRLYNYGSQLTDAHYDAGGNYAGKNLATLFTGAPSSTHGIVGQRWIDSFSSRMVDAVYGVLDDEGRADTTKQPSNSALLCSTLSNEIRKIYNDKAKILSVGFDRESLVWSSGINNAEPSAWIDARSGRMLTSNVSTSTQKWIDDFNSKSIADVYLSKIWAPRKDISEYYQSRFFGDKNTGGFYHILNVASNSGFPYSSVCGSPYGNSLVRDFAAAALTFEEMGKDEVPDMLTVHLSATPAMGKKRQPLDPETEDMLLGLDDNISSLLHLIDVAVGMDNTLVVFTAAQGSYDVSNVDVPQWKQRGTVSLRRATTLLNLYLMAKHGQAAWVKAYMPGTIYLNRMAAEQKNVNFDYLVDEAAEFLTDVAGIGEAIPAKKLNSIISSSAAIETMRRNYFPKRSGDILLKLEPGWAEELDDGSLRMQLWKGEYVPLVFYGWKIPHSIIYESHNMADVVPTICSFLKVAKPDGCCGNPIVIPFGKK